jgi:hypothetical protein
MRRCRPPEQPHSGQTVIRASSICAFGGRPLPGVLSPCSVWPSRLASSPFTRRLCLGTGGVLHSLTAPDSREHSGNERLGTCPRGHALNHADMAQRCRFTALARTSCHPSAGPVEVQVLSSAKPDQAVSWPDRAPNDSDERRLPRYRPLHRARGERTARPLVLMWWPRPPINPYTLTVLHAA